MSKADERTEMLERAVHDLKNPLAVVRASLEWLEVELVDRPDALDAVRDSATACKRLVRIADDLEILARLESGVRLECRSVPVAAWLASASSACAPPRDGSVAVEAADDVGAAIGDPAQLGRALEALVDACVRGARAGSVVTVSARRDGATVTVTVAARGAVDAVAPEAAANALASAGLGAYLALRIAAAHGGGLALVATDSATRMMLTIPADTAVPGAPPERGG